MRGKEVRETSFMGEMRDLPNDKGAVEYKKLLQDKLYFNQHNFCKNKVSKNFYIKK